MDMTEQSLDDFHRHACNAADFLKAIGHEGRLMILCDLTTGEKSVSEARTFPTRS